MRPLLALPQVVLLPLQLLLHASAPVRVYHNEAALSTCCLYCCTCRRSQSQEHHHAHFTQHEFRHIVWLKAYAPQPQHGQKRKG